MIKRIKAESKSRKGVRLGASGGSLFNDLKGVDYNPVYVGMYTNACKIRKRTEETTKVMNEKSKAPSPFFSRGKDFARAAKKMVSINFRVNGEFYVLPTYQFLIDEGMRFQIVPVEKVHVLGTPKDLDEFIIQIKNPE